MKNNRRNMIILFVTLVVMMLGFGMIIPLIPFYIDRFDASGSELGLLMATFATAQFLFAPIWGQLSDRYGRKPILAIGVLGFALSQLFFGLSTAMWMLFASRVLAGILSAATLPTTMAYIGDSTSDKDRGGGMGMLGAAIGLGMVLGPGIGGWLATRSLTLPFFVAAAISMLILVFILVALPESLPKEARTTAGAGLRGPQFGEMWQALLGPMGFLLVLAFLVSFGLTNFEAIFGLYALERYDYSPRQVGTILTATGLASAIVQGGLIGPLTRRWGEVIVIRVSMLGSAIGFVLMLLAQNFVGVLVTVTFFVVSNALLRPAVSSLISRRTTTGQGMAMGLNNSFMSLGRILGPAWAGFLFDSNISYPYLTGSFVMLVGFVTSLIWLRRSEPSPEQSIAECEPAS